MYKIMNRNNEEVNAITLKNGEWCRFIGSKGGEYIVTNVQGKKFVTKPCDIKRLRTTKEIKDAPIYLEGERKHGYEVAATTPAPAFYEVSVYIYTGKMAKETFNETFIKPIADAKKYIELIADKFRGNIEFSYFIHKNRKAASIINGVARDFNDVLNKVMTDAPEDYPAILAAISDPDNDPDGTPAPVEPTPVSELETRKEKAYKEYKAARIAWIDNSTQENWIAYCNAQYTCKMLGVNLKKYASKTEDTPAPVETSAPAPVSNPDKPDYSAFDADFKACTILSVTINGKTIYTAPNTTAEQAGDVQHVPAAADSPAVPAPAPLIDETAARRGHEAYCTSDYKAGSATAEYNAGVSAVKQAADKIRGNVPEEYRGELDKLVNRYAVKLADWTNRKNNNDASCPSWFITGAAKYPHRKHEKQMERRGKLWEEYDRINAIAERVETFDVEVANRAARIASQRKTYIEQAGDVQPADITGDGFRVVRNTSIMRLQFLFDSKPDEQTRTALKANGFKWAPSQMAWQRQLTANAERAASAVAEKLQKASCIS